ncbi:MAG: LacI family DNA-binding transcriptional regulator [Lachnospiraceae bacterium]|nr:LacI family DNA-binding transcriptional regulator [Lachnospiraceae bacterium]MDD3615109.1 LacI family DNA-binding transcriptional regulator [Lachnospiraceae bacterium]
MAATIKDIAKKTGLGLATISSYINGGNVRETNRIKIEEAIEELHYEINEVARGLKTNSTKIIGVVIPELNNIFCTEIITSVEDILRNHGYATIVCDCRTDVELEKEAVDFLYRKRVDGIINMPVNAKGSHLRKFKKAGKPIVLIDRVIQELRCDSVVVDNRKAAHDAVKQFFDQGHKKIGIIAGPEDISTANERLAGYMEAWEEQGLEIPQSLIFRGDYTIESGVEGLETLVKENPDMTGVLLSNYEITMGAMIGINELGINIPDDLSVIGFDNLSFARACKPKLTVVTQPTEEIGMQVAHLILERLEHPVKTAGDKDKNNENNRDTKDENLIQDIKLQTKIVEGKSMKTIKE